MAIFDSHAHYDDEAFDGDRADVIDKIKRAGVERVLNCGASMASCETTCELTDKYDFIYGAVGIHPENVGDLAGNINKIGDMAARKKILAIGEIGLDYYYDGFDRDKQLKCFREQMDLAAQLKLPVVIHNREAHEDTLKVISEFPGVMGTVHCFSGSVETAREVLKRGYYIGFTGVITFKNPKRAVEVLRQIPEDRILVETDCPYMAPVPHRGERNDSSLLVYMLQKIAEVRGISYEKACDITFKNAERMLGMDKI